MQTTDFFSDEIVPQGVLPVATINGAVGNCDGGGAKISNLNKDLHLNTDPCIPSDLGGDWRWGDTDFDSTIGFESLYAENFLNPSLEQAVSTIQSVTITAPPSNPENSPVQIVIIRGQRSLDSYGLFPLTIPIQTDYMNMMYFAVSESSQSPCGTGVAANKIDWNFIEQREGASITTAYVPNQRGFVINNIGVTVATGFDIGQHNVRDLNTLNLTDELVTKLTPYTNLTGQSALDFLRTHPLTIDNREAAIIDDAVHNAILSRTVTSFDNAVGKTGAFYSLPSGAQTAIADMAFNFGSIAGPAPNFWYQITHAQWTEAIQNLNTWETNTPGLLARRQLEAGLIQNELNNHKLINGTRC